MMKVFLLILMCALTAATFGCSSTETNNTNSVGQNGAVVLDPANMPPGLTGKPVPPMNANLPNDAANLKSSRQQTNPSNSNLSANNKSAQNSRR